MPRIARVVIPEYPHHVIHRGNRREKVFFSDEDKQSYLNYLRKCAKEAGVEFWGYCLMDNHVHFIILGIILGTVHLIIEFAKNSVKI
jgi:putative transposase